MCVQNGSYFVLFNDEYELWTGRVAMLGVLGLVALEVYRGSPLL